MLPEHYFNAWTESRTITYQIATAMKEDSHFKLDFKPHPEMNSFGKTTGHLVGSVYHQLKNYMKMDIHFPEYLKGKEIDYDVFVKELDKTDKMIKDLFTSLTLDDLEQEAYFWKQTKTSYSKGWVVMNLIAHERWTQAQLKMYLKIMGCDTSKIGH